MSETAHQDHTEKKAFLVNSSSLKEVRTFCRDVFEKLHIQQDLKDELVLAIAEAAQNIVKHAFKNSADANELMVVQISCENDKLQIAFYDRGTPVDPKKVKHRKWHKGRSRKRLVETRGTFVDFGSHGLQALEPAWLNSRQIEAGRRAVTRSLKREGSVWIRVFPDKPITKKAAELGMGKGKGAVDHYVFPVRPGRIIFEVGGVVQERAILALKSAGHKMPFKTRIVSKQQI